MRGWLMRIFSEPHGGVRTIRCFEEQAPPEAHRILATILVTSATELAVRTALSCSLDALEPHLPWFAGPGVELRPEQRRVIATPRVRVAATCSTPAK
jgi:hypothetical protein